MRVCDWIAHELYNRGVRNIYGLMGGGASGLNDGFISHGKLKYICFHHEQGAGHAATAEAKLTKSISVVNPTTGCGGTNCITSVLNAWQDSVPVLFISGNVKKEHCSRYINDLKEINIRKYGIQEHDIIKTVESITKYSYFVEQPTEIAYVLGKAIYEATTWRAGPVWIDIPSDIQVAELPNDYPNNHLQFEPPVDNINFFLKKWAKWHGDRSDMISILDKISTAARPIILAGQGIKQSNNISNFKSFIESINIPFVSTYGARDLLPYDHLLNIGAIGIKGSRAGNFAMQSSDLIITMGCSVNASHIGYDHNLWAPYAYKICIDVDANELEKKFVKWNSTLICDLTHFFVGVEEYLNETR